MPAGSAYTCFPKTPYTHHKGLFLFAINPLSSSICDGSVNPALNPSKSKQLGLIKGLEYLFSANRTSICVFTANCTSVVKLAQFSQSGVNDKKITAAFLKTQPKAAKKEQLAAVARVKALIEHGVRKVGKMAILTLFS